MEDTTRAAVEIIAALPPERLSQQVTVQKRTVTGLEAIYIVMDHFAQHAGQIMFATKLVTGQDLGYYRHLSKGSSGR